MIALNILYYIIIVLFKYILYFILLFLSHLSILYPLLVYSYLLLIHIAKNSLQMNS